MRRAAFRAHPWLVGFDDVRSVGPHAYAWTDSAIRVFEETGLSSRDALTVVEAVSGYIRGHVAPVIAEDQARQWADPYGRRWDTSDAAFLVTHGPESGRFPAIESVTSPRTADEVFEAGLEWLLDGVAARIRVHTPRP